MNLYGRSLFNRSYYLMHWLECVAFVVVLESIDRIETQKPLLYSKNNGQQVMMNSEIVGKKFVKLETLNLEFYRAGADIDK